MTNSFDTSSIALLMCDYKLSSRHWNRIEYRIICCNALFDVSRIRDPASQQRYDTYIYIYDTRILSPNYDMRQTTHNRHTDYPHISSMVYIVYTNTIIRLPFDSSSSSSSCSSSYEMCAKIIRFSCSLMPPVFHPTPSQNPLFSTPSKTISNYIFLIPVHIDVYVCMWLYR